MRIGPLAFTPGAWPTIGAVALIALTVWLGRWQTDRGDEKEALQKLLDARIDAPVVDLAASPGPADVIVYRRVRAKGRWIADAQFFVDNQVFEGRAGFHVITPLRIEGSQHVALVDRGWIERTAAYPRAPDVEVPAGDVLVSGIAALPPKRYLELSTETVQGNVWQNLSIERYRGVTGRDVLPFVVDADVAPPGLTAVRERPDTGIERHREYSLTWYSLAATALVLWVALNLRRAR
ncbi:MAG TPA: SURF1 family protein [Usitatibacter sp.]|nr:SURF1 family protein [Usitatibacter sp.]